MDTPITVLLVLCFVLIVVLLYFGCVCRGRREVCCCWQQVGSHKQANAGTRCFWLPPCCGPRSGRRDEQGRPIGKWLPENPCSQEAIINYLRVYCALTPVTVILSLLCATATVITVSCLYPESFYILDVLPFGGLFKWIVEYAPVYSRDRILIGSGVYVFVFACLFFTFACPMTTLGQLYHNVRANRRDPASHTCCANPFSCVAIGLPGLLVPVGLILIIIGMTPECVHVTPEGNCMYPGVVEWRRQGHLIAGLLLFLLLYLFVSSDAMYVRVQIRKRDRIPERCTGSYDAACCFQNDCESCSCCEDCMATYCNPFLSFELGRMLMHIVHASEDERYVESSPYGTHYDPSDVEAAAPLITAHAAPLNTRRAFSVLENPSCTTTHAAPPITATASSYTPPVTNTHHNRTVPTGGFVGRTLEMTSVPLVAPVQAETPPAVIANTTIIVNKPDPSMKTGIKYYTERGTTTITAVAEGSIAQAAGLAVGDVLVAINGCVLADLRSRFATNELINQRLNEIVSTASGEIKVEVYRAVRPRFDVTTGRPLEAS